MSGQNLIRAISWFLLSVLISNSGDIIAKYMGDSFSFFQTTFLRFFFSFALLLPLVLYRGWQNLDFRHFRIHLARGGLLVVATSIWFHGLTIVPLASATTLGFSIPFFTLILAAIILRETIDLPKILATICGFVGVWIVVQPTQMNFQVGSLALVGAAFFYALLDVVNKKYSNEIPELDMLFFSSAVGSLLSLPSACTEWVTPTLGQWGLLLLLGATANLILFCILRAYRLESVSFLAPFHYVELLFSCTFGFLFFQEIPSSSTLLGALIIFVSILFLGYCESKQTESEVGLSVP